MLILTGVLAVACLSCTDRHPLSPNTSPPEMGGAKLVAELTCHADVPAGELICAESEEEGTKADRPSKALYGQNQVKLTSSNVKYTAATGIFGFDVTLTNLSASIIGTPDGLKATGSKAFYETGPTVTSYYTVGDTGTISVGNPDGRQNFTGTDQPYHFYPEMLPSGHVSQSKRWELIIPNQVKTFAFTVRVFTATPGEPLVPQEVPSGWDVPGRYFDPSSSVACDISGFYECVFDAVAVLFVDGATQEERQAAVNVVRGVVEGGDRTIGLYFVRIPGDSTLAGLRDALTRLRQLPQVRTATPYGPLPFRVNYAIPTDGNDWRRFEIFDTLASGKNWGLEAISAPLAWGCETGATNPPVAVVDSDFDFANRPDLNQSLVAGDTLVGKLTTAADNGDHGTQVAAIMAARGNNQTEMTGVLWPSRVRVYESARDQGGGRIVRDTTGKAVLDDVRTRHQVEQAVMNGAIVVNLSQAFDWSAWAEGRGYIPQGGSYDPGAQTHPKRIAAHDTIVRVLGERMTLLVERLLDQGKRPLFVLGAGNDGISATWNPFTRVSARARRHILIVGSVALTSTGRVALSSFSNRGDTLDIVAPGEDVWTLDRSGPIQSSGTSLAAPYVTGVAGLMVSFDPRLRGDSIKLLMLEAAANSRLKVPSGSSGDSVAVVNAYESLKTVARRSGAPLCGNLVWWQGGKLMVLRDSTQVPQTLFTNNSTSPLTHVSGIDVLHGGRVVRAFGNGQISLRYQQSGWFRMSPDTSELGWTVRRSSAVWMSANGMSHDRDTVVQLGLASQTPFTFVVSVQQNGASSPVDELARIELPLSAQKNICMAALGDGTCIFGHAAPGPFVYNAVLAYDGLNRRALLAIIYADRTYTQTGSNPIINGDAPPGYCNFGRFEEKPTQTEIWSIPLRNPDSKARIATFPSAAVTQLAVVEDGTKVLTHMSRFSHRSEVVSDVNGCSTYGTTSGEWNHSIVTRRTRDLAAVLDSIFTGDIAPAGSSAARQSR